MASNPLPFTGRLYRSPGWPLLAFAALLSAPGAAGGQVAPAPPAPAEQALKGPAVVIQFEGGDYSVEVPRVLEALRAAGHLETAEYQVETGDDICGLYLRKARLPGGCSPSICELALALNPSLGSCEQIHPGQVIRGPAVSFRPHGFTQELDPRVASELSRAEDLERWWGHAQTGSTDLPDGSRRLAFRGYDLVVPLDSDAAVEALATRLWELASRNVVPTPVFGVARQKKFYALSDPSTFWTSCSSGSVSTAGEANLGLLLGDSPASCVETCRDLECPELILVDTAVLPSQEWVNGFGTAATTGSTPAGVSCVTRSIDEATEHGTHMAGILVAAENGFGIRGIAPEVPLQWLDYPQLNAFELGRRIQERSGMVGADAGPPIFVFASSWCLGPVSDPTQHCPANIVGDRFTHAVAKRILDTKAYWITAAGEEGETISPSSPRGPMNLGDLSNVIVVAACDKCVTDPSLLPSSMSDSGHRMVHVAAPGRDIPSTLGDATYASASGTSQATAFVAGVAAKMLRCYPDYFGAARERLKTRLQASSRPFPPMTGAPRDASLSAGVLDATAALLDPTKDWIRLRTEEKWTKVRVKRWLLPELPLLDRVTGDLGPAPRIRDLRRLVHFEGSGAAPSLWVAYADPPHDGANERLGEIERFGPGMLADPGQGAIELCSGAQYRLDQLGDVLLSRPLSKPQECGS
jgi:hypothetical protein